MAAVSLDRSEGHRHVAWDKRKPARPNDERAGRSPVLNRYMLFALKLALAETLTLTLALALAAADTPPATHAAPATPMSPIALNVAAPLVASSATGSLSAVNMLKATAQSLMCASSACWSLRSP